MFRRNDRERDWSAAFSAWTKATHELRELEAGAGIAVELKALQSKSSRTDSEAEYRRIVFGIPDAFSRKRIISQHLKCERLYLVELRADGEKLRVELARASTHEGSEGMWFRVVFCAGVVVGAYQFGPEWAIVALAALIPIVVHETITRDRRATKNAELKIKELEALIEDNRTFQRQSHKSLFSEAEEESGQESAV